jgi:hypothetical protein
MIRFGEATALAEILHTPLERFTRPVSEASEVEKIRAASARLDESCEAVAAAVCRLLDAQRAAKRLQVLNAGVQGDDLIEVALVQLRGWMRECTVDRAILKGRRRFKELDEKRDGSGEGDGTTDPAPENAGELEPASGDERETVGAARQSPDARSGPLAAVRPPGWGRRWRARYTDPDGKGAASHSIKSRCRSVPHRGRHSKLTAAT